MIADEALPNPLKDQRRLNHAAWSRELARELRSALRQADADARACPNPSFRILFYAVPRCGSSPDARTGRPVAQPACVAIDRQERVQLMLLKLGVRPEQIWWAHDDPDTAQLGFL